MNAANASTATPTGPTSQGQGIDIFATDSRTPASLALAGRVSRRAISVPSAEWLARQITEAFPWASAPAYLVRDNDRVYGRVFTARVRAMGIRDRPTSLRSPWQNGIAERLIGTLRRECLDQVLIYGEGHLRRILLAYAAYYNRTRTHLTLQKDAPLQRIIQRVGNITAIPILRGLHHEYIRI